MLTEILEVTEKVDGKWGEWSEFSDCTKECYKDQNDNATYGDRTRTRTCTPPVNGGDECIGEREETDGCALLPGENIDKKY